MELDLKSVRAIPRVAAQVGTPPSSVSHLFPRLFRDKGVEQQLRSPCRLIQRLPPQHIPASRNCRIGVRIRPAQGYPLGVVSDGRYENVSFTMAAGDRLTLYTDGLLEARNAARELFGFDRVRNLIATSPDADAASDAAVAFGQDDDITVLTVTRVVGTESAALTVANEIVSSPA